MFNVNCFAKVLNIRLADTSYFFLSCFFILYLLDAAIKTNYARQQSETPETRRLIIIWHNDNNVQVAATGAGGVAVAVLVAATVELFVAQAGGRHLAALSCHLQLVASHMKC